MEQDIEYDGHYLNGQQNDKDYGRVGGRKDSVDECQQLCQATAGCAFFTYNPQNQFCHLKTSDNGRLDYRLESKGIVSGPKFCGN